MRPELHESTDFANILDAIRLKSRKFIAQTRTPAASQDKRRGRIHALIRFPGGCSASVGRRDREKAHQVPSGMRRNTPQVPPFLMGCLPQIALRYLHHLSLLLAPGSLVECSFRKEPTFKPQSAITSLDRRCVNTCAELTPSIRTGRLRKLEDLTPPPLNTKVQRSGRVQLSKKFDHRENNPPSNSKTRQSQSIRILLVSTQTVVSAGAAQLGVFPP